MNTKASVESDGQAQEFIRSAHCYKTLKINNGLYIPSYLIVYVTI